MRHKSEELMQQILNYAEKFLLLNHRSPYTSEIADALGIVKSTVYRYLVEMNERGMLSYHNGEIVTERTEKLSPDTKPAAVLGSVSCGMPQLEEEYVEEYVSLPVSLFGDGSMLRNRLLFTHQRFSISLIRLSDSMCRYYLED